MSLKYELKPADLEPADDTTLKEILRQAESHLAVQVALGTAADQRAMSFVSLLAAATAVVAGAGGALLLADKPFPQLGWTCIAVAGFFVLAMLLAAWSARPAGFHLSGSQPGNWVDDVKNQKTLHASLLEQAVNYDEMIIFNRTVLEGNSRWMKAALIVVALGLVGVGGVGVYLLAHLPPPFIGGD